MSFSAQSVYGVIPQPFYGVASLGTSTPNMTIPTSVSMMSTPNENRSTSYPMDDKPPVTTVFVGNITERAPDAMIKLLLQKCGNVLSWKRVQGASGKLQAFGFCEYEDPEATLRCIRLLNEWKIGEKNLVVKVDPKTKDFLNEYKRKKRAIQEAKIAAVQDSPTKDGEGKTKSPSKATSNSKGEGSDDDEEDTVDDMTLRDDETIKIGLENILKEYSDSLSQPGDGEKNYKNDDFKRDSGKNRKLEGPRHLTIEDMDLDNDRKDLINHEIAMFRSMHKDDDDSDDKREKERERERERARRRREAERHRDESGDRSLASRRGLDDDRRGSSRSKRTRSRSRDRDSRSKSGRDDQDEMRKRLEREMRKKEEAYKALLTTWEDRERKKQREYQREEDKKKRYEEEKLAEARRLKEFLQDYDDDVLDSKYYKGSALSKRLRDRDIEKAADDRDRQKEVEEVDAMRQKLIEEGDPDAEKLIWQMEQKMEEHLVRRLQLDFNSLPVVPQDVESVVAADSVQTNALVIPDSHFTKDSVFDITNISSASVNDHQIKPPSPEQMETSTTEQPIVDAPVGGLLLANYGEDDDDDEEDDPAQYSMMPDQDSHPDDVLISHQPNNHRDNESADKPRFINSMQSANEEVPDLSAQKVADNSTASAADADANQQAVNKKQIIKNIIDQIPTQKEELFAYHIEWDIVDEDFVTNKIRPWVDKKIISYIGEEEPTLTNFICEQVLNHCDPEKILRDISMVLDEEAEVFVVKMWRLLIYCIKEKHAGIETSTR